MKGIAAVAFSLFLLPGGVWAQTQNSAGAPPPQEKQDKNEERFRALEERIRALEEELRSVKAQ
ncbi:MAG TPA: hypothetical protein VGQ11_08800, partial [Candidatus Acidoferrales bacterium]|nr:hypothetical protein [Candidatus Acidoferrales bacterium]